MKVMIFGAGAIGCYFGGKLAIAGHEVCFIAKGENLVALREHGLSIESINGDFALPVTAHDKWNANTGLDLVIVCVKLNELEAVLPDIQKYVSPDTTVIGLQNGVESDNILKKRIPSEQVLGGIAFIGAERYAYGKIRHTAAGFLTIDGKYGKAQKIRSAFLEAGVKCHLSENIDQAKWEKLVWNNGFNGLAALTDATVHQLLAYQPTRDIVKALMEETIAIANANGMEINKELPDRMIANSEKQGDVVPSMLQDVRNGRKTEIDFLNGKVVRDAETFSVPVPYNKTIWAAVSLTDRPKDQTT